MVTTFDDGESSIAFIYVWREDFDLHFFTLMNYFCYLFYVT